MKLPGSIIPKELLDKLDHMETAMETMVCMATDIADLKGLLQQLVDIETARDAKTGRARRPALMEREERAG